MTEDDLDGPYLAWLNDPEVCRFTFHHVFPYTRDDARDYITDAHKSGKQLLLAIITREDDRHVDTLQYGLLQRDFLDGPDTREEG